METYHVFLILLAIFIILANSYAISFFMRNTSLFSKTNYMLLSLAISEFMTGAVNIPTIVYGERLNAKSIPESMTIVVTADITTVLCAAITMLTLCSIIVDRYLVICFPMHYVSIVTKRKIVMVIIASWMLPIFISFLRLSWLAPALNISPSDPVNSTALRDAENKAILGDKYYYVVATILYFIVVVTLIVLFVLMFRAIKRLGRDEREFTTQTLDAENVKREHKAAILFGVMFIAFILCWTPLVVFRIVASFFPVHFGKIPTQVLHSLIIIRYLTSVINPLLYILYKFDFNQEFKKDLEWMKRLLSCHRKATRKGKKDALTEVSFLGNSIANGQSTTYWPHSNGHMKSEETAHL